MVWARHVSSSPNLARSIFFPFFLSIRREVSVLHCNRNLENNQLDDFLFMYPAYAVQVHAEALDGFLSFGRTWTIKDFFFSVSRFKRDPFFRGNRTKLERENAQTVENGVDDEEEEEEESIEKKGESLSKTTIVLKRNPVGIFDKWNNIIKKGAKV